MIAYICQYCRETFTPKSKRSPSNPPKYCGYSCYHAATISKIEKTCKQCGIRFKAHRGESDRLFCSRKCYLESNRAESVKKQCPICGDEFSVPKVIADRYQICSLACRHISMGWKNCPTCGRAFRANMSKKYGRRFCSFACYRKSKAETSIEKTVREALKKMDVAFIQEHRVGRYSIDFFIPSKNICLEADGKYWHSWGASKERESRRDEYIKGLGYRVYHLPEENIRGDIFGCLVPILEGEVVSGEGENATIE